MNFYSRIAAIALGASLFALPTTVRADTTLHVATTPIELGAQVLYAKDQGFFKKAGLDVEVQLISSGGAIAPAVASGSLDIAQSNLVSLATAHEKGLPFVVLAAAGLYDADASTTSLVVAKSSTIKTGKDLVGKTIAVNGLRNITEVGASAWVDREGGDASKVRFIEMPFPQMAAALESGRVDAAVIAEPELSVAIAGGARIIAQPFTAIAKQFLIGAWFSTTTWAKDHPDLVKRFVAATIEGGVWANGHRAESAKILEKYTKIHVSAEMKRTVYATRLEASDVQPLIEAAARYHAIKASFPAADLFVLAK